MSNTIDMRPVLEFLADLRDNNSREWFEANRPRFEAAKKAFEALVQRLIEGIGRVEDVGDLAPKDCIMRIFRDVRFSKDKTPYNTHMGASIVPGGRKSNRLPFYLHVAPGGQSFIAGGMHVPEAPQLASFRTAIDRDAGPFKAILAAETFRDTFEPALGESLKTAPKGYAPDHPEIELLRLKEICAVRRLSDQDVLAPDFADHVLKVYAAMKPFLDYMNQVNPS